MPRSKRYKKISLTQTKKKGLGLKQQLVEDIRSSVDKYDSLYLFSVQNMRNAKLKQIRTEWKDSRFFFGKNRVMGLALGRGAEDEYKDHLHEISRRLRGQCGLLFTNRSKDEVLKYFKEHKEADYARSGNIATQTVTLPEGPLEHFPFNMEPYLRQLGLPTSLKKGVIMLVKAHSVCKEGATLTPEQAQILKLLGQQMAEFAITIEAMWSKDGEFEDFGDGRMLRAQEDENVPAQLGQVEDSDDDDMDGKSDASE
nr:EOG090X0BJA [Triops cancriformis]